MADRAVRFAKWRTIVLALLMVSATAAAAVAAAEPAGGLKLVVTQGPEEIEIMVAARVAEIRPEWDPPLLAGPEAPAGLTELLVVFHDKRGRPVGVFGFPGVGADAFDVAVTNGNAGEGAADEILKGRISFPAATQRILEAPLPRGAAYLAIALARPGESISASPAPAGEGNQTCVEPGVPPGGPDALELTAFNVYALGREFGGPRSTLGEGGLLLQAPFAGFPTLLIPPGCQPVRLRSSLPPCSPPDGTYLDTLNLPPLPTSPDRFDVVILGDGFKSNADLTKLKNFADQFATGLRSAPPFNTFAANLKIDLVRTTSTDSGITNCPTQRARSTYYAVEGMWPDEYGVGGPGYLGTNAMCRILSAVERVVPWWKVDIVVMIANCDESGGRAQFGDPLMYLTTHLNPNTADPPYGSFKRIALHEAGHVVGGLGEEYVACAKPNPSYPFPKYFPNVAPGPGPRPLALPVTPPPGLPPLGGGAILYPYVWWQNLLLPAERNASGNFAAVHRCNDGWQTPGPPPCGPAVIPPGTASMLGMFWGAMYGEPTGAFNQCKVLCEDPTNPTGPAVGTARCDYYRPQANCRMRTLAEPWCRACMAKMKEAIPAALGP